MSEKRYYIFITLEHSRYYIPNITKVDLDSFVISYQKGDDPFINGTTYSLDGFSSIKIFEVDSQFDLNRFCGFAKYSQSGEYAIYYHVLDTYGTNVTGDFITNNPMKQMDEIQNEIGTNNNVFIVHGRDESTLNKVARFLESLGLSTLVMQEQANKGKTIIEKLEAYSNVAYVVVLYTPCDKGCLNSPDATLQSRARQNVVFEHGYFIAKHGRERVCALLADGVEEPSDIHGIGYIDIDSNGAWKMRLAKELKSAGLNIDLNKLINNMTEYENEHLV